jgi:hypothetical protein
MLTLGILDHAVSTAAQQPLPIAPTNSQSAPPTVTDEAPARLARLRRAATGVMGGQAAAVWLETPSAALGGLAPVDLAADSNEGYQEAFGQLMSDHQPKQCEDG